MDDHERAFLGELLETPSPSGFETRGQRVWVEHVEGVADEVWTDAYGNAIASHEGSGDGPEVVFAGHADEIGFIVREVDEAGFVRLGSIGGADRTVSRGQHVTVHVADGPVPGVIGRTAIHLRDGEDGDDAPVDVDGQHVDLGADDAEAAAALVEVGDPVTVATTVEELSGTRLAARGMDDRVGTWAAAAGLRRASEAGVDATVHAVSTVQEEVGLRGAAMVGFDLAPDAVLAIDVTHATDDPGTSAAQSTGVELGGGPVVARGSTNHPVLVERVREAAAGAGVPIQLQAAGTDTGTDADAFYTQRGGIPSLNVGVPNRYMHTPVEVIDTDDLDDLAALLGAFAADAGGSDGFDVEV
jgi:endoglucanase